MSINVHLLNGIDEDSDDDDVQYSPISVGAITTPEGVIVELYGQPAMQPPPTDSIISNHTAGSLSASLEYISNAVGHDSDEKKSVEAVEYGIKKRALYIRGVRTSVSRNDEIRDLSQALVPVRSRSKSLDSLQANNQANSRSNSLIHVSHSDEVANILNERDVHRVADIVPAVHHNEKAQEQNSAVVSFVNRISGRIALSNRVSRGRSICL